MTLSDFKKNFAIENRTKYFVHVLFCFFIISIIIFILLIIGGKSFGKNKNIAIKEEINPFRNLIIEGKGVIVFDVVNNREIFSKNPDLPLPLASLTKVMAAVTTDGELADNQKIEITRDDLEPEGDSQLVVGDTWRAKDLRDFTLITSSNDGAFALAAVAGVLKNSDADGSLTPREQFIKEMNETASKIGLLNSKFFNEHGLDREADRGGAYGSARDMAILFEYTLKNYPEILEATRYKNLEFSSDEKKYSVENTNVVIDKIPNLIASKTGYTELAGGNLIIAFDVGLNRPIIVAVLGSSEKGRFIDVLQLVEATIKQVAGL